MEKMATPVRPAASGPALRIVTRMGEDSKAGFGRSLEPDQLS